MNKAELFVQELSKNIFLSMWGCPNPQGKEKGKELCDFLVVCDPNVIIFSVKEIEFNDSGNPQLSANRWRKKAIDDSVKQLYGAERFIKGSTRVITGNGKDWLLLPELSARKIFRIAVALGSKGQAPISSMNFGKGFVHVFDEISFMVIMQELDTINDFVDYLKAKEELFERKTALTLLGAEEDLIAIYLHKGRSFPVSTVDVVVIDRGMWQDFLKKPEYLRKKEEDKISYAWDQLIETFCKDFYNGNLEVGGSLDEIEETFRVMARENRFNRRLLAKNYMDLLVNGKAQSIRARKLQSPSKVVYIFSIYPKGEDRQYRRADLGNRCFVARGITPGCDTVIGIATEAYEGKPGFSLDAFYFYRPIWTEEDQSYIEKMQKEFNYFVAPKITMVSETEYPQN